MRNSYQMTHKAHIHHCSLQMFVRSYIKSFLAKNAVNIVMKHAKTGETELDITTTR